MASRVNVDKYCLEDVRERQLLVDIASFSTKVRARIQHSDASDYLAGLVGCDLEITMNDDPLFVIHVVQHNLQIHDDHVVRIDGRPPRFTGKTSKNMLCSIAT